MLRSALAEVYTGNPAGRRTAYRQDRTRDGILQQCALFFGGLSREVRVTVLVVSAIAVVTVLRYVSFGGYAYTGVAFEVRIGNSRDEAVLRTSVEQLKKVMVENVCLSCPHVGVALQCIVWNDGRVWTNPVILERSAEESEGYETAYSDNSALSEPKLTRRAASLRVRHDSGKVEDLEGGEAHCLAHCMELFYGTMFPPS